MTDVYEVKKRNRKALLALDGVVSVGVGYKISEGKRTGDIGIIVSVKEKKSKLDLNAADIIPSNLDGVPVDVIESKEFYITENVDFMRPAPGGISIGHEDITAGTFGCVVMKDGVRMILSNNHVLANSNKAELGDSILQPGPHDGGTLEQKIGTLEKYIPIVMEGDDGGETPPEPPELPSECNIAEAIVMYLNATAILFGKKTRVQVASSNKVASLNKISSQEESVNYVDCALCKPDDDNDIENYILEIGNPLGVAEAVLDMPLQKSGRTTGYTNDTVLQVDATVKVNYGEGKTAVFEDQFIAGPMSAGGDSGSAVLNDKKEIVGLLFAGSKEYTIINKIQHVFDLLDVSL